jgi:hypothetical protein
VDRRGKARFNDLLFHRGPPCFFAFDLLTCEGRDSYREILNLYLFNPESKFNAADGKPCSPWTRGLLHRRHIVAGTFNYCGKESKRKLEQGPVDHDIDFKVKVYESGRLSAEPETLRALANFSERDISKATGLKRDTIRIVQCGGSVRCLPSRRSLISSKGKTRNPQRPPGNRKRAAPEPLRSEDSTMQKAEIKPGTEYALREKRIPGSAFQRLRDFLVSI